ncbi:MAG TPA: hypothetical protein VH703_04550 [Solirubrobacterales bacterium]
MFVIGLLLLAIGLVGAFLAIFPPVEAARGGMIGVALGCGLSGVVLTYLSAPGRRPDLPPGKQRAKATILDAVGTTGSVAGYQMVELTLEVRPKRGVPFQVKRKFSAGRLGRIEQGRSLDIVYDPANPERLELA